jgi:hypothetical protein
MHSFFPQCKIHAHLSYNGVRRALAGTKQQPDRQLTNCIFNAFFSLPETAFFPFFGINVAVLKLKTACDASAKKKGGDRRLSGCRPGQKYFKTHKGE